MTVESQIVMELMDDFADSVDIVNDYVSSDGVWGLWQRRRVRKRAGERYKARFDRQRDAEWHIGA